MNTIWWMWKSADRTSLRARARETQREVLEHEETATADLRLNTTRGAFGCVVLRRRTQQRALAGDGRRHVDQRQRRERCDRLRLAEA
jgi:hypothetical protein